MIKISSDKDTKKEITSMCSTESVFNVDEVIVEHSIRMKQEPPFEETSLLKTKAVITKAQDRYADSQLFPSHC